MEKIKINARRLDVLFHVMRVACTVAAVSAVVGLLLIGVCFLFNLDPEIIGTGYNVLKLEFLELEIAAEFAPDARRVLAILAMELAAGFIAALLGRAAMGSIRGILAPMKQGSPFHENAAQRLKRLALLVLILGVVLNASEIAGRMMTGRLYGLTELLCSDRILHVIMEYDPDFTCLLISGILLLLSYIFRYGQELQRLSDETL